MSGLRSAQSLQDLKIERIETYVVGLPVLRSFGVSGGPVTVLGQPALRVLVRCRADGVEGWGEATPLPSWTYETVESIVTTIDRYLAPALIGKPCWDTDGVDSVMDRTINRGISIGAPLAKGAVDVAIHDLLGRALGIPLGVLWGQRRRETIDLAWVVSGQSPTEVADSVAEGKGLGYEAFKVKIGLHADAVDAAVVAAVRETAPYAPLWVDANQAYTVDRALRMDHALRDLNVSAFEQPLPANDIAGLRRLRERGSLTVALDESIRLPSDLANFIRLDAVDVLGAREVAGADLGRIAAKAIDHRPAHLGVALDELRGPALMDTEQVVEDEHLAVGCRARPDPDHRDLELLLDHLGDSRRHRLEDDREAANGL